MATYEKIKTTLPDGIEGDAVLLFNERDTTLLGVPDSVEVIADEYYTFSVWVKPMQDTPYRLRLALGGTENVESQEYSGTKWQRIPLTFISDGKKYVTVELPKGAYFVYKAMLEQGNIMSDWNKAQADYDNEINLVYSAIEQVADKISLIVADGSSQSSLELTPEAITAITKELNLQGNLRVSGDAIVGGTISGAAFKSETAEKDKRVFIDAGQLRFEQDGYVGPAGNAVLAFIINNGKVFATGNLEFFSNINAPNIPKHVTHTASNKALSTTATSNSITINLGILKDIYSVTIRKATPKSNWNNGAIVSMTEYNYNKYDGNLNVYLSTNNAQNYDIILDIVYGDLVEE